jgi:gliding motility-associated-like protein
LTLKLHLFKNKNFNKYVILFLFFFCFFSIIKLQAQLGFCTGNSGDPIFTETFGTGTTSSPLPTGTTTYQFSSGYPNDSFYTVSNGTLGNGYDWHQVQDHTFGDTNGKCLIVNAAAAVGEFYKTTITGLCETTTYEFSAWLINLVRAGSFCSLQPGGTIPVNVRFEIWDSTDTILIKEGNTGNIIETTNPIWTEYGLVFQTSVGQNAVILKMINNGHGGCGNDLAIDDIEFKSCGDLVTVTDSSNNNSESLCSSQLPFIETLTAIPDFAVYGTHYFQWQKSIDGGNNWVDIAGEINQTLSISPIVTTFYRSKIAEFATNVNYSQCVSFSSEYQVTINQAPSTPTLQCWETASFNVATCSWDIIGAQPIQPIISCWETTIFNSTTCVWDVTGIQPVQPLISCWETATFNTTTCNWDITGNQPIEPTGLSCWETATFNLTTCSWDITGTQPLVPSGLSCWETTIFNSTTCVWDIIGTQPGAVNTENLVNCSGTPLTLYANTSLVNPTYLWSTGETTDFITADSPNVYSVEITSSACFFEKRIFNVTQAPIPNIDTISSDGNNIVVKTSNSGNFLYSLDGNNYQSSNIFFNIKGGEYTIYVKEQNCPEIATKTYLHFYIPKYFTPNNDGVNDAFSLSGIEFYSQSQVSIFNRFGKLIKFSQNAPFSWDGTFNNVQLPSDDYWYIIIILNQKFTGHFTLKR